MTRTQRAWQRLKRDHQLLIIFLPCLIFYIVFRYGPMYGIIIAFKKYNVWAGVLKSPWVGLQHFEKFFTSPDFFMLFKNTFLLGLFTLLWTFPFPIIFAVLLNELKGNRFKRTVQTVSYLPSFLSVVIISSMVIDFLSPSNGMINLLLESISLEKKYFMILPEWFRTIYISSDIWAGMGAGSIIYLAALAGIDPTLYEAGKIDGCSRLQSIWYISLPGILPTVATMFIIKAGNMFRIGFEKVLLLYNPVTYEVADVFSTYVYRKGLLETNFSYATAVGLFESVVALVVLLLANKISRKISDTALW